MTTFEDVWRKLCQGKEYREHFACAFLKRSVPFQIKTLRKKHCGSQAILAERSGVTQGVVSRAEDQDYGNLTLNTIGRIAGGLDVAFIGRFVPFSDLVNFSLTMSEKEFKEVMTFEEEHAALTAAEQRLLNMVEDQGSAFSRRIGPQRAEISEERERAVANLLNPGITPSHGNNLVTMPRTLAAAMGGGRSYGAVSNNPI